LQHPSCTRGDEVVQVAADERLTVLAALPSGPQPLLKGDRTNRAAERTDKRRQDRGITSPPRCRLTTVPANPGSRRPAPTVPHAPPNPQQRLRDARLSTHPEDPSRSGGLGCHHVSLRVRLGAHGVGLTAMRISAMSTATDSRVDWSSLLECSGWRQPRARDAGRQGLGHPARRDGPDRGGSLPEAAWAV